MMLALYAAFWLQLENASPAAVTVGILAMSTRGQAYRKAVSARAAGASKLVKTAHASTRIIIAMCRTPPTLLSLSRMQSGFPNILRATARAHSDKRISFSGLDRFVMLGKVETFALAFFGHPKRQE